MSWGVVSERRQSTVHLAREMFTRSQGWGAIELCAVLDIVISRLLKEEPEKGTDLLVQQIINVLRKREQKQPAGDPIGLTGWLYRTMNMERK